MVYRLMALLADSQHNSFKGMATQACVVATSASDFVDARCIVLNNGKGILLVTLAITHSGLDILNEGSGRVQEKAGCFGIDFAEGVRLPR